MYVLDHKYKYGLFSLIFRHCNMSILYATISIRMKIKCLQFEIGLGTPYHGKMVDNNG